MRRLPLWKKRLYNILKHTVAWGLLLPVVWGVPFGLFLRYLWKRYWVEIVGLVLVGLGLLWWNSSYVVAGRPSYEQLIKNEQEWQRVKKELEKEKQEKEEIRKRAHSYCDDQRKPNVCKTIFDIAVPIEEAFDLKGFSYITVTLARSEQNYVYPSFAPFNLFGMGGSNLKHYSSYQEAVEDLADWFLDRNYRRISPKDFPTLARTYKVQKPYAHWIDTLNAVWQEIT